MSAWESTFLGAVSTALCETSASNSWLLFPGSWWWTVQKSATFEDLQALFTSYQKRDVCSPEDGPFGGIYRDSAPKFLEDGWLGAAVAISFCLLYIYIAVYNKQISMHIYIYVMLCLSIILHISVFACVFVYHIYIYIIHAISKTMYIFIIHCFKVRIRIRWLTTLDRTGHLSVTFTGFLHLYQHSIALKSSWSR